MSRLTRAESQERTRVHLVGTALRLFMADGYTGTSLERVATEAGFSKGAVYSNFRSKQELGLAALDRNQGDRVAALLERVGSAKTVAERLAGFRAWAEEHIGDEGWTSFEVEFATANRHDADVRAALAARRTLAIDLITGLVEAQSVLAGAEPLLPARQLAETALGLGIGLGVQRAIDPTVSLDPLVDLVSRAAGPLLDRP